MAPRTEKLLKWVLFSVVIALLPLVANFVNLIIQGDNSTGTVGVLIAVLAHGELLLISGAIAADAIGDLIGSGSEFKKLKYLSGGACLAVVLLSSLCYASIAASGLHSLKSGVVARGSVWMLALTVLASGCAKFVAED